MVSRPTLPGARAQATGPGAVRPRMMMPPVLVRPLAPHAPPRGRPPRVPSARTGAEVEGLLDEEYEDEEEEEEELDEEDEAELEAAEQEMMSRGVHPAVSSSTSAATAARESSIVTVLPPGTPAPVAVTKNFVRPVTAVPSAIAGAASGPTIIRPAQPPLIKNEGILRPASILPPPSPAPFTPLVDTAAASTDPVSSILSQL